VFLFALGFAIGVSATVLSCLLGAFLLYAHGPGGEDEAPRHSDHLLDGGVNEARLREALDRAIADGLLAAERHRMANTLRYR
jgi:hypothetical protein